MNARQSMSQLATLFLASLSLSLVACGGGSGGGGSGGGGGGGGGDGGGGGGGGGPPTASITMEPGSFDFGLVTEGNLDEVPAQRFIIRNNGSSAYNLSSIRLEGGTSAEFNLDLDASSAFCGSAVRTLSPGASCEAEVRFAARDFGIFDTVLVVQSNDPVAPTVQSNLAGTYAELLEVNVAVSQVSSCPRELPARAFVSVTDQGGFPVRGLGLPDFSLRELGQGMVLDSAAPVADASSSISVSILMDYSRSISDNASILAAVKEAARVLVQQLGAEDEADIVKFSNITAFMLEDFSSNKVELLEAIETDPELPRGSRIYGTILDALERLKERTKDRKAVIVLTDGRDNVDGSELDMAIAAALEDDIPVFPVGFGSSLNRAALTQLAADTGGGYYEPAAAENLNAVYQQLANLLIKDQYVLSYMSATPADATALVEVLVEYLKDDKLFEGSGSKIMLACPSN